MLKITSAERFVMAPPNQGWSLALGANHFSEIPPDAVSVKLAELLKKGFVSAAVLSADGTSAALELFDKESVAEFVARLGSLLKASLSGLDALAKKPAADLDTLKSADVATEDPKPTKKI